VRRKPYSVVLLDEIEKAHPDVFNILLQVLDDGRLTDNKGRTVDFRNTIIIMTSNIGSHIIQEHFEGVTEDQLLAVTETTRLEVMELLRKTLRPEFLNRIDEVIMFKPLLRSEIHGIVELQLKHLAATLEHKGVSIQFSDALIAWLSEEGFDPQFGARPLKRVIQKEIINELSKRLLDGTVSINDSILADIASDQVVFVPQVAGAAA
jgi:ATP-dependent Clp protease ATP-binding subunit ClpB